ncbi:ECF transporter S component [Clostridium saudiense]|nr:ECF transporter S component [Clostridium saudiense]
MNNSNRNVNKMIKISLLVAIAVILMYFDFPVIPLFPWLKIDLSEVPALMGGFAYGPVAGGSIVILKVLLRFLIKGTETGFIGELANIIVGLSLVVPSAWIYNRNKSKKTAIIGMIVGGVIMEVLGIIANVYFLLPAYGMQMSPAQLSQYVIVGLLPFNGIKALIVGIITYILYKKVSLAIFKVDSKFNDSKKQIA